VAVADDVRQQDAVHRARLFLDALNERDADAMRAVVTDDVEIRLVDGRSWQGADGVAGFLDTAREMELRVIPLHRGQHAEEREGDGVVYVEMRVRELIRYDDIERIADFTVRDGHVASFALRTLPDA
jgi:ketosteroid isomerase-like protein